MNFFLKTKRAYLRAYLIFSVRRIEKAATAKKRWDVTPVIMGALAKLLIIYVPILIDDVAMRRLKDIKIQTQFDSLESLEIYCHEFINQTVPFIEGEVSKRPKVESSIRDKIYIREMSITKFLKVDSVQELGRVLGSIVALSERLDDHLEGVSDARRNILLNILRETILPVYTTLERTYEVINGEE